MAAKRLFTEFRRTGGVIAALVATISAFGADQNFPPISLKPPAPNISLRNEVQHAIDKGWAWLAKAQDTNGFWSTADLPAITGLALTAFQLQFTNSDRRTEPAAVKKGYAYLMGCARPDGGIYQKELPSYNTSISLVALVLAKRQEYQPVIKKARSFIIGLQADLGEPGKVDNALDGGIGYGKSDKTPDLSNTVDALEAMYLTRNYLRDQGMTAEADLNWAAAIHFIQSCQNLPGTNTEKWASGDPQNKGGFIYAPGVSKAGQTNLPSGRVALRSYGSMSYAGLLSYIYAELSPDDPRITAVLEWLRANYTLDENPAMGAQGLYYYYHTMAKALTLYGANSIETTSGQSVNWREQLALKLINLQHTDGSWANENGRFFEKDPALITSYVLISLEMIQPKL